MVQINKKLILCFPLHMGVEMCLQIILYLFFIM